MPEDKGPSIRLPFLHILRTAHQNRGHAASQEDARGCGRRVGLSLEYRMRERLQHRLQCCIGARLNGHLRRLLHLVYLVSTAPNPSFPVTFLNLSGVSSRAKGVLKFAPKSSMYPTDSYPDFDGVRRRATKKVSIHSYGLPPGKVHDNHGRSTDCGRSIIRWNI